MRSLVALSLLMGCATVRRTAVAVVDRGYEVPEGSLAPTFDGPDAERARVEVRLAPVAEGLPQLTDLQPIPGHPDLVVALRKSGEAAVVDLTNGQVTPWFREEVASVSEQGLLGLAFHPNFAENGRFFVNSTPAAIDGDTRIAEWRADPADVLRPPTPHATILEVDQPYQNHNAGQLQFGPDGFLYVGLGDGGYRDDPRRAGQDGQALLGKMLRLDVDGAEPYEIPADNPFVDDPAVRDEVFALGLRNPWRYSFDPDGRLVVADVGQNTWEELDLVPPGANLGWSVREGPDCFRPSEGCDAPGLVEPVYAYGRDDGSSITGGYVVTGDRVPDLRGQYVFGDFVTGRIWVIELPAEPGTDAGAPRALGRWPILLATFGRDGHGDLLVGDFGNGVIYRVVPGNAGQAAPRG